MAAAEWDEVKKLAEEFQRTQLSISAHKLSERNCIEIVNKLVQHGLVEVFYTTDGREYLTPQHLETEIRDEVVVSGGRVNLVDLQQILNVDLSHIENKVSEILKADKSFTLIQGELIDKDYLDRAAEEINETLQEAGQVSIGDLSKTFNLPTDFLISEIESRIGSQIHGQLDPLDRGLIFTQAFVDRYIAKVRGILSGVTRPTQVSTLVSQYGLPEKLFYSVLESLAKEGRITGTVQGRHDKALFIPDIYTKTQHAWIDSFFTQNGYIEYDTLTKLGISDGKQYLKRRFQKKDLLFLQTCCVGKELQEQIDSSVEEAISTGSWVNIQPLLPSPFTDEDAGMFLHHCLRGPMRSSLQTFCNGIVTSTQFLNRCKKMFEIVMKSKAETDVQMSPSFFAELTKEEKSQLVDNRSGEAKIVKKEERHKKASQGGGQKGGAGRGGRETKTKKVKDKSKMRGKGLGDEDDDEEQPRPGGRKTNKEILQFLDNEEIESVLKTNLPDCESEFIQELAAYLHRPLQCEYQETAKSVFLAASGNVAAQKRKSHSEFKEKVSGLWINATIFNKGICLFEDELHMMLSKHLLKTVCQDIVNVIFEMVASDNLMSLGANESFTPESRLKLLNRLSGDIKAPLTKLNASLNTKDTSEFLDQFDIIAGSQFCDLNIRKVEKKKERQLVFNHRQALMGQLQRELEPAMALHLTVVLLLYSVTKCIVHVPGRIVPQLIHYLGGKIDTNVHDKLTRYQGLVLKSLSSNADENGIASHEVEEDVKCRKSAGALLADGLLEIKDLVLKSGISENE